MIADARHVLAKEVRIELRSRVGLGQTIPFSILVLVLFAFALDPDRGVLTRATAGLYWVAVVFAGLLAIQRSFAIEAAPGVRDAIRLSGMDPAGYFLGKAGAIVVQLLVLEVVLAVGVAVLYAAEGGTWPLLVCTALAATAGVAAAGTLYGVLAAGLAVRDTLVPLLLLPVLAPVLLGATRATEAALGDGVGNGWSWCGMLAVFAAVYTIIGMTFFGTLLEET